MPWLEIEGAYVLLPCAVPWGVIHFVGGAVLGSYPHIVYNELFTRVSRDSGVAVIATPYDVGLDHRKIASSTAATFQRALDACLARYSWNPHVPVFALGHSLGGKIQVLRHCTATANTPRARQVGLLAFNNADVTDSVRLVETFVRAFNRFQRPAGVDTAMLQGLFRAAEVLTAAAGIKFTPDAAGLREAVRGAPDAPPMTCFKFETDELDCSATLLEDQPRADVITLPGDHLAPVFLALGLPNGTPVPPGPAFEAFAGTRWEVGKLEDVEALSSAIVKWLLQPTTGQGSAFRTLPNGVIDV